MSKGQTVWPLEQLTSKSSSTRYLKNYLTDFYEIWCAYANSHGEYLYSFWGSGNVIAGGESLTILHEINPS